MKTLRLFFIITGIITSHSMYGSQVNKYHTTTRQEWKKFHNDLTKDPKFAAPALSQELAKPASYGILAHSMYGNNTAKNPYQAIATFDNAQKLAQQSRDIGAPLPLGTFYNMSYPQKEITKKVYGELLESTDKSTLLVSAETWREIGSDMPAHVKKSLPHVTVQLQRSLEQKIEYVGAQTVKGAVIGASGAAIVSLAKESSHNALKETEKKLWSHKNDIAKEAIARSIKVITNNSIKAIDNGLEYATAELNAIDFDKAGQHCDYENFYESHKFFTDTAKQAGNTLKDEFISASIKYGIELAVEHAPSAVFNPSNIAINTHDVYQGTMVGAGLGLAYGILTIDNPIQQAPINNIYCKKA